MDFGLAKAEAGLELTSTGQFMGTPLYMAPEQALGQAVDRRTDLFSLGSVAYTLLTGRRAFEAESVPQVLNRVVYRYPPPPTTLVPSLPAEVDYVLGRAMAKRQADRYPDGRSLAEDIEDLLDGRPPRHRGGWAMPELAEGTMVSARGPSPQAEPELELELIEPPRGAPRGKTLVLALALGTLAFGAALVSSPFWRQQLAVWLGAAAPHASPVVPPPTRPAMARARPPSAPPTVVPQAGSPWMETPLWPGAMNRPTPTPPATTAAAEGPESPPVADDPVPDAIASPAPSPAGAASPAPAPARVSPATSRLSIALEHGLKEGTLRVLVDQKLVLEEKLTSRVTRDLLLFKLRTGSLQDVLPIVPGRRRVRIEVRTGGQTQAREIAGTFRPGATRRLDVDVGRGAVPSLKWK
jgi:hypothetical protein